MAACLAACVIVFPRPDEGFPTVDNDRRVCVRGTHTGGEATGPPEGAAKHIMRMYAAEEGCRPLGMAIGMPYLGSPSPTSVLSLYCTRKRQVMRTVRTTRLCAAVLIARIGIYQRRLSTKSRNSTGEK